MKIKQYKNIIKKYKNKYKDELKKIETRFYEDTKNYNEKLFKNIMLCHRNLVKEIIKEVINEFEEFKQIRCCIMINGSLARATNTMYSDIDLNYFYDNKNYEKMIKVEEQVNYILQSIMKYRGKDRIHSMVVYLPLIKNNHYDKIDKNRYPIYLEDGIIYNRCRENAQELMLKTYNSTREISDLWEYLNKNDNTENMNEWANCFELIFDNGLYDDYVKHRIICKSKKNISKFINKVLLSIEKDNNYISLDETSIKIKDLKLIYKMNVLYNTYEMMAIYFRLNEDINSINLFEFEKNNVGIEKSFYKKIYNYLSLIQRLQYILDNKKMDLSYHSLKKISNQELNDAYNEYFKSDNILLELNDTKKKLYKLYNKILKKELSKYE